MVTIVNNHEAISASDYWGSEMEQQGAVMLSPNAGALRLLVPQDCEQKTAEMARGCEYVIVTRGQWLGMEAVELLFEDHSSKPYMMLLSEDSCSALPGDPGPGRGWKFAVWTHDGVKPTKVFECPTHFRRVSHLPWLQRLN